MVTKRGRRNKKSWKIDETKKKEREREREKEKERERGRERDTEWGSKNIEIKKQ